MADKPLFSVVEELKGIKIEDFYSEIYNPDFWLPYIPLKNKSIQKKDIKNYTYKVDDTIYMDVTKTLKYDFESHGSVFIKSEKKNREKGYVWELIVNVIHPEAHLDVNIRARNTNNGLKVGFFVYKLEFDMGRLKDLPFGRDAIIFAGRFKLRELLKNFEKEYKK